MNPRALAIRAGDARRVPGRFAPAAACALSLLLTCAPARAELFADNDARRAILELRGQIAQLQQDAQNQKTQDAQQIQQVRGALLDLSNQIEQMKNEVAQLRGQQDSTTRQLNDALARMAASQKDLSQRLAPLEPVTVQIGDRTFSVQPAEKAAYERALATAKKPDFAAAGTQFKAFIEQYPSSPYLPDAQYWLGNSLFAQKQYKDAAGVFGAVAGAVPPSWRAPEAMLGLANCQLQLHQMRAARDTLKKLAEAYPQTEAAQAARDRLAKLK